MKDSAYKAPILREVDPSELTGSHQEAARLLTTDALSKLAANSPSDDVSADKIKEKLEALPTWY